MMYSLRAWRDVSKTAGRSRVVIVDASMGSTLLSLTIDDLPWHVPVSRDRLRRNLDVLSSALVDAGVAATGFVNGGRRHLAETRLWLEAGFGLGNHTYSHVALSQTSSDAFVEDIVRNERVVLDTLGYDLRGGWFRYPYLDHGEHAAKRAAVTRFLQLHRYTLAPVSINTCDYAFAGHEGSSEPSKYLIELYLDHVLECVQYFTRLSQRLYVHQLSLVLLIHANELNACCIGPLVGRLREEGCKFVELVDALSDPVYRAFATAPPAPSTASRGDFLGDVARLRGVSVEPDPSRIELCEAWAPEECSASEASDRGS